MFHLGFMLLLCLYAFYVSRFNSEKTNLNSVSERYSLLAKGIYYIFTQNSSMLWIAILLIGNYLLMFRNEVMFNKRKYIKLLIPILIFSAIYISLLPLGGYRSYRPFIIRYDTLMPITFMLVFLLLVTSIHILSHIKNSKYQVYYGLALMVFIAIFSIEDRHLERDHNQCQKQSFYEMKANKDSVIQIPRKCTMGTWSIQDADDIHVQAMLTKLYRQWDIIEPYQTLK
jgi:hypothetical protein